MIRGGNNFYTLFQKLYFFCLPTCRLRSKYIQKHSYQFRHIGNAIKWQPRKYPADPEYISIGNNVKLSANVSFITHDICHEMFNHAGYGNFKPYVGCIEIGNNVMIGANVTIMPNVKIGDNVIIAAGSIITKDCQNDTIWGGIPAKLIGYTDKLIEKRANINISGLNLPDEIWRDFYKSRQNNE